MANRDRAVIDALVRVAKVMGRNQDRQEGNIRTGARTDFQMYDYSQLIQKTKEYEEVYNERASAYRNSKTRQDANNKGRNTLAPKSRNFKQIRCGKCGKDHYSHQCKEKDIICFKCFWPGHMSRDCHSVKSKPSNNVKPQANKMRTTGHVFALSSDDASTSENLMQGTCVVFICFVFWVVE